MYKNFALNCPIILGREREEQWLSSTFMLGFYKVWISEENVFVFFKLNKNLKIGPVRSEKGIDSVPNDRSY